MSDVAGVLNDVWAFLLQRVVYMLWSFGSSMPMIFAAVFKAFCSRLQSWAVRLLKSVGILSMVQWLKIHQSFGAHAKPFKMLQKAQSLVSRDRVRVSEMCMPRNLKLSTIFTDYPLMETGMWFDVNNNLIKNVISLTFRERLLSWHHMVRSSTSLL